MSTATLTSKGQITLPKAIRTLLHLRSGDKVDFQTREDGSVQLVPVKKSVAEVFGCLAHKVTKSVSTDEMDEAIRKRFR